MQNDFPFDITLCKHLEWREFIREDQLNTTPLHFLHGQQNTPAQAQHSTAQRPVKQSRAQCMDKAWHAA